MKNLRLPLKNNWFEMTELKIKPEDYRDINAYWCNRLFLFNGENKSKNWWQKEFFEFGTLEDTIENIELFCSFKNFDFNIMTLGYPKKGDTKRILTFEHKGIEVRTGNSDWGAEPNKLYFVILHGEKINLN